jgi:hypothetical protein
MLPVDLPHESDTNDCRDQPTSHHGGSAVAELGGDEGAAEDPNHLESALWDPEGGSAQRIFDKALTVPWC